MPLELRPNCEACDTDLPASSPDARICSYECTYCAACAEHTLANVCPNCGGNLTPRPIRPSKEWREGLSTAKQPPSEKRVHLKKTDVREFVERVRNVKPEER